VFAGVLVKRAAVMLRERIQCGVVLALALLSFCASKTTKEPSVAGEAAQPLSLEETGPHKAIDDTRMLLRIRALRILNTLNAAIGDMSP